MTENEKDMQTNGQATNGENEKSRPAEDMSNSSNASNESGEAGELEKKEQEINELRDKYLRLQAEFDNYRKRTAKEKVELLQTAGKEVILSLLDVLDDSDRALKQLENTTDIEAVKDGVKLVFNKLKNTLQAKGLKPMESLDTPFDPDLHDAITEIPAPTPEQSGKVVDVLQPGYYLNDKLIRHAKVIVGK
ncbi:molecular chaperone GrpE [Chitinophaga terrae (ex Kim and Jung 2007)]|uniref:Protein GrpE n=1 Tax=Chitinophaga terrae (ex Kim and Jung 2007) TaxID=408074 RepID=A0A1H4DFE6_9BACT|nr:nucleotide exchange factor GrpE [Chitinophaga terrae (ex Kim and Jung 2007)]MDQ0107724.1 molecular chaperone GrpE [Chitinophaga terrae (ex Kim and Jung 2007)]GEP92542.1 protein GrpE [Chitinophaga terrae (ex Kim and Jung 2007)]SEA71002.1 molecular chaperone GrpE [Chitinophaga terrae (ex Kim and Jung 2007)]